MLGSDILPRPLVYFENHRSSLLDPSFISSYIKAEQEAGRYSRGFTPAKLEELIGPFQTSPLGLVPKPGSSKFRLIQDMSFPRNDPSLPSVNSGIDSDHFPTAWGTFDSVLDLILSLPPGCVAATFDISAAYRITPIRPDQQHLLCISWDGSVYVDRAVMFGLSSSAGVFGAVADMLVAIYTAAGIGPIRKWVDDFFAVRLPGKTWTEEDFMTLTGQIGVPWSHEKLRRFATVQKYIGFWWDLDRRTVALPEDKLKAVRKLVQSWLAPDFRANMKEAATLHGKLVHCAAIFPLIRPFLPSITMFIRTFTSARARLHPGAHLLGDLSWIRFLLHYLPNSRPLRSPTPIDIGWWGDASTSFGVGVIVGSFWAVWRWAPGFVVGPREEYDIGWAEAVAVDLGLRLALQVGAPLHAGSSFLVKSDNTGIVTVVNKGRSRNRETNKILKHVYRLQAERSIRIHATHIPSRENIADALSRGDLVGFRAGFPSASTHVHMSLPAHLQGKLISVYGH